MRLKLYAAILHFLLWEILVTYREFKTNYLLYAAILHFLLWEILVTYREFKTNYLLLLLINKNLLLYMLHGFSVTILKCYKDAYQALIQTSVSRFGTLPQFIKYILAKTCFCCKIFLKRFEQVLVNFQCHFSGKRCLFLLILIFKVTSCLCNKFLSLHS